MSQEKEKKGIRGNDKRQISGLSANAQTWRVLAMNPRPRHIPESHPCATLQLYLRNKFFNK